MFICCRFDVQRLEVCGQFNHARRDSNPQPTVLETATLPIELLAFLIFLFRFLLISSYLDIPQVSRARGRVLIQNIAHATGADRLAAFTNGEANRFFHRDWRDQLDFD